VNFSYASLLQASLNQLELEVRFESLRKMFSHISGMPEHQIPDHWIYLCNQPEIADAVTTKNAIQVRMQYNFSIPVNTNDPAWSSKYKGRVVDMVQQLLDEGYLRRLVKKSA